MHPSVEHSWSFLISSEEKASEILISGAMKYEKKNISITAVVP